MKTICSLAAVLLAIVAADVSAAPVQPVSYDMLNGDGEAHSGSFNYWDLNYTGSGSTTTDRAPLTGGLGDLTDGVKSTLNWFLVENDAGTGPYVGWRAIDPTITFHFGQLVSLSTVTLHVDDSGGAGGVSSPIGAVLSNGTTTLNFVIADPAGFDPFSVDLAAAGLLGTDFTLTLLRGNEWVFMDEVSFDGTLVNAVAEPATVVLLGLGLAGLGLKRRRRA